MIAYCTNIPPLNRTSFGFIVALSDKHCAICSPSLAPSLCPFLHCQKLRRGLPGSPQHLRLSHPLVFPSYRFSLISTAKKILVANIPTWETATDDNRRFAIIVFNLQISGIRKEYELSTLLPEVFFNSKIRENCF